MKKATFHRNEKWNEKTRQKPTTGNLILPERFCLSLTAKVMLCVSQSRLLGKQNTLLLARRSSRDATLFEREVIQVDAQTEVALVNPAQSTAGHYLPWRGRFDGPSIFSL